MKYVVTCALILLIGWRVALSIQAESFFIGQPISKAVYSISSDQPNRVNLNRKIEKTNSDFMTLKASLNEEGFEEMSVKDKMARIEREKLNYKYRRSKSKQFNQSEFFFVDDVVFERWVKVFENLMVYTVVVVESGDGDIDVYGIKRCVICM